MKKKNEEEQKKAEEAIEVDQDKDAVIPINEDMPKVLVIGDSAVGKTTLIA
jgi:hypothetical protein